MHIDIHHHAEEDLDALWENKPAAAAEVVVTLEILEADPRAIDKLTTYGDIVLGEQRGHIKSWITAGKVRNLWRLRVLDTPATQYRIVYGYHWQTRQLCILAIVHKDKFDYDDHSSEIVQRIFTDWDTTCHDG
jgi:mRNA-degrading endonuclease RelE of RelBE toxin-antitoxin system